MAATVAVLGTSVFNTTAGNKTITATPTNGDLIVIVAATTGASANTIADNQTGGTYTQVGSTRTGFSTSGDLRIYVRNSLITSGTAVSTIYTATQTSSTGGGLVILRVTGMGVAGASAVRSSGGQSSVASGTTPAPVLSLTPLSANPIIYALADGVTSSNFTPRSGYTEDFDAGYSTPGTGLEVCHIVSGETSATITSGGLTSGSISASIAIELAYDTAPTVALNAPSDTGTVSTTTPQVTFTGTDADSDAITYEVQIDSANTFGTTIDSYATSNQDSVQSFGPGGLRTSIGQSFTGDGTNLNLVTFNLDINSFSSTGTITAEIYAHTGTYGSTGTPTGSALATSSSVNVSSLTNTSTPTQFVFSSPLTTVNTTKYFAVLNGNSITGTGLANVGRDTTSPTHAGNGAINTGSWAADATVDYIFAVGLAPLIDKLSNTDTGFVDITNGAHSDPFTSGEQIGYTVQAGDALTNGVTYYWRVRGKDPSGTNTYGAWATTRSFTVSAGSVLTKTQPAVSRIATNISVTQPATARVAKTVTKTQAAISRLAQNYTKTQPGISRISNTKTKTQPAISRVANVFTKTQSATANIAGSTVLTKTQPAVSRIATNRSLTQSAVSRVAQNFTKTQSAVSRVANNKTSTQPAVARIQKTVTKTQPAVARVATNLTKTQPGISRIANNFTKTQSAVSRVAKNITKTQPATANIITNSSVSKTQPAVSRIATNRAVTQTAVSRVANNVTKTQPAISRISQTFTKTQGAISRVATNRTVTQPATAHITASVTKTQPAVSRIANTKTKTQPGISRISNIVTKTQPAISRVANVVTKTQSATANIAPSGTVNKTQPAVSRIATNRSVTQSAISRIANNFTKTQPAISRVAQNLTKTQAAVSRVATNPTKTQPAVAKIASTVTKTQPGVSRISNVVTKTQPAVSRIANTKTKTQSAFND